VRERRRNKKERERKTGPQDAARDGQYPRVFGFDSDGIARKGGEGKNKRVVAER